VTTLSVADMMQLSNPAVSIGPRHAIVADRDPRVRGLAREALNRLGLRVSFAESAADAMAIADGCRPDLLICDADLEQQNLGLHLAETFRTRWHTSVVFLTSRTEHDLLTAVAASPAWVVCKPLQLQQLEITVRVILHRHAADARQVDDGDSVDGEAHPGDHEAVSRHRELERALRQIATLVLRSGVVTPETETHPPAALLSSLRPREQEVVRLMLQHYRVPAIAARLGITAQTVRNHLKSVFRRTGVRSQQELLERFRGDSEPQAVSA
jgi:DNA-binding NarL/FixJ family response regulator